MRPFEILLILLLILLPLARIIRPLKRRGWIFSTLGALLALVLMLQLFIEQLRWQLVPLYALALYWLVAALRAEFAGTDKTPEDDPAENPDAKPAVSRDAKSRVSTPPTRGAWIVLLLALIFALPPVLLPVPQLPQPGGPYPVGTTTFYWEDPARPEIYTDTPDDTRRLMVQVWYPAEAAGGARAEYIGNPQVALPALAKKFNIPAFLLSHLELAATHAVVDAAAAPGRFPVLLFSHGWTGIRMQNTFQMEELASRGYVVFAPDHTYGAMFTVFPDGAVALNKRSLLGSDDDSIAEYDRIARILGQTWVGDLRFVLQQAARVDSGEIASPLQARLDLAQVGMLGHSTGGGAVIEACALEENCLAGLSMDAWLIPYDRALPAEGLEKPFLFMQSELWSLPRNPDLQSALYEHMRAPAYRLTLLGASHYDFSDIPLITPLAPLIGLKGPIPAERSLTLINQFSVAFFDQYLKGIPAPLLQDAEGIREVILEKRDQ